ncbi:IS2 transposase (plasmid) [Escherichia sp. HH091_1A]|nr:IS2 transposase [Escherichia sp. HH091_1A]
MLPSETMIWQPEFTDKTLSRKPGAVHNVLHDGLLHERKTLYQGTAHRVVGTISLTMEVEILKEAVEYGQSRKWIAHAPLLPTDKE